MVAFVLALISIVLVIFVNTVLGLIFGIIALVMGIVGIKKQEKFSKAAVGVSIATIIIFIIVQAIALLVSLKVYNNAQEKINQAHEEYQKGQEQIEMDKQNSGYYETLDEFKSQYENDNE